MCINHQYVSIAVVQKPQWIVTVASGDQFKILALMAGILRRSAKHTVIGMIPLVTWPQETRLGWGL